MKLRLIAVMLAVLGLGWWGYHYWFDTYPVAQVAAAEDLVEQYYDHLQAGEYSRALGLVAIPEEQVRDWNYEREWRARYLDRARESGEYRIFAIDGTELIGGPPHNRPGREDLTFYTSMVVDVNGKRAVVGENLLVAEVDGRLRIVDVQSTDHFVRYRAFRFELPRVSNPQ